MSFADFLNQAWADHGDRPQEVLARLKARETPPESKSDFIGLVGLLTHIYGDHLGQWAEGIASLQKIKSVDEDVEAALKRSAISLELSSGSRARLAELTLSDRVRVLAMSAAALAGQAQIQRASELFLEAIAEVLPKDDPAVRSLAITANNLAGALEEKPSRSAKETELMIKAAQVARSSWELAGTWMNVERAEYRLAKTYLAAAHPELARKHARECLRICEANNADDFEMKYAREIVELAEKS